MRPMSSQTSSGRFANDTRTRPVRRLEAAAVQQHEAMIVGEPIDDTERVVVFLEKGRDLIAEIFPRPRYSKSMIPQSAANRG